MRFSQPLGANMKVFSLFDIDGFVPDLELSILLLQIAGFYLFNRIVM